ncbi:DNA repair protein RecN [Candidatus Kapaibacterium sp.]
MIKSLLVKDFALITESYVKLDKGLNVILGETGSGKSMLIDALSAVFGERVSAMIVRNGAVKSVIEVEISITNDEIIDILKQNEIELFDDHMIIRREISAKSGSRNFVNDTPVNMNILKQIGEKFIDFHGQHEHQSLLNSTFHAEIFDKSAKISDLIEQYSQLYYNLKNNVEELNTLINSEKILREKYEYSRFKLEEILKVNPVENEDLNLEKELNFLENSEILYTLSNQLYHELYDDENSIFNKLSLSLKTISKLTQIDTSFDEYFKELESALIIMREVSSFTNDYYSNIEFNPEKIEQIRLRLLQIKSLQKKYGSVGDIIKLKEQLQSELILIEKFEENKNKLINEINELKRAIFEKALIIEQKRVEYSKEFSGNIVESLNNLGINNATFEVKVERNIADFNDTTDFSYNYNGTNYSILRNGINNIEFFISTNLGESPKPLQSVASGGEVSRIMLSIKNILADKDNISCLVFDEIDTGVSGRIAQMVGKSMSELSKYHQIISISHLPQIVAYADMCILVEKIENADSTTSSSKVLNEEEKIHEIAKLISGSQVSDESLRSAELLINNK